MPQKFWTHSSRRALFCSLLVESFLLFALVHWVAAEISLSSFRNGCRCDKGNGLTACRPRQPKTQKTVRRYPEGVCWAETTKLCNRKGTRYYFNKSLNKMFLWSWGSIPGEMRLLWKRMPDCRKVSPTNLRQSVIFWALSFSQKFSGNSLNPRYSTRNRMRPTVAGDANGNAAGDMQRVWANYTGC